MTTEKLKVHVKNCAFMASLSFAVLGAAAASNNIEHQASVEHELVTFVDDVDKELIDWGLNNPNTVAIGAKLGEDLPVSIDRITSKITNAIQVACPETRTKFIFERIARNGSVFSIMSDGELDRAIAPSEITAKSVAAAKHLCTTKEILSQAENSP